MTKNSFNQNPRIMFTLLIEEIIYLGLGLNEFPVSQFHLALHSKILVSSQPFSSSKFWLVDPTPPKYVYP